MRGGWGGRRGGGQHNETERDGTDMTSRVERRWTHAQARARRRTEETRRDGRRGEKAETRGTSCRDETGVVARAHGRDEKRGAEPSCVDERRDEGRRDERRQASLDASSSSTQAMMVVAAAVVVAVVAVVAVVRVVVRVVLGKAPSSSPETRIGEVSPGQAEMTKTHLWLGGGCTTLPAISLAPRRRRPSSSIVVCRLRRLRPYCCDIGSQCDPMSRLLPSRATVLARHVKKPEDINISLKQIVIEVLTCSSEITRGFPWVGYGFCTGPKKATRTLTHVTRGINPHGLPLPVLCTTSDHRCTMFRSIAGNGHPRIQTFKLSRRRHRLWMYYM